VKEKGTTKLKKRRMLRDMKEGALIAIVGSCKSP
jgi:hypothetical protein